MSTRDDAWILTFTGRRFWPLDPRAEDVCIDDIAHALALTCRFTGHCREFYSVAQHSVLCASYVAAHGGSKELQLAALLHDASEAYLPDVARPVKHRFAITAENCECEHCGQPGLGSFRNAERVLMASICSVFCVGLWNAESKLVKQADIALLLAERRDLMPDDGNDWRESLGAQDVPPYADNICALAPREAEHIFLVKFLKLSGEMKGRA